MKNLIPSLLVSFLLAGCAASAAAASASAVPTVSSAPAASASASGKAQASASPQTVPAATAVEGVVTENTAEAISLRVKGSVKTFQKGDGIAVYGILERGAWVSADTFQSSNGDELADRITVSSGMTQIGTLKDEAMSTITLSAEDPSNSDSSFVKDDSMVREDGIRIGDKVTITFSGSPNFNPMVYYMAKKDPADTDIRLQGIIESFDDQSIQMLSAADGSSRTFARAAGFQSEGELKKGMQTELTFHHLSGPSYEATYAIVNDSPLCISGRIISITPDAVAISAAIGSENTEYTLTRMDLCFEDADLKEGDEVTICYAGEIDLGQGQAYSIVKG